jgi:hypothetical protein
MLYPEHQDRRVRKFEATRYSIIGLCFGVSAITLGLRNQCRRNESTSKPSIASCSDFEFFNRIFIICMAGPVLILLFTLGYFVSRVQENNVFKLFLRFLQIATCISLQSVFDSKVDRLFPVLLTYSLILANKQDLITHGARIVFSIGCLTLIGTSDPLEIAVCGVANIDALIHFGGYIFFCRYKKSFKPKEAKKHTKEFRRAEIPVKIKIFGNKTFSSENTKSPIKRTKSDLQGSVFEHTKKVNIQIDQVMLPSMSKNLNKRKYKIARIEQEPSTFLSQTIKYSEFNEVKYSPDLTKKLPMEVTDTEDLIQGKAL